MVVASTVIPKQDKEEKKAMKEKNGKSSPKKSKKTEKKQEESSAEDESDVEEKPKLSKEERRKAREERKLAKEEKRKAKEEKRKAKEEKRQKKEKEKEKEKDEKKKTKESDTKNGKDEKDESKSSKKKRDAFEEDVPAPAAPSPAAKKLKSNNGTPVIPSSESADSTALTAAQWRAKHFVEVPFGCPEPYQSFTNMSLPEPCKKALAVFKFTTPTPIQAQSWPIVFSARDMIGIAETGSGKTLAFLLPAIDHVIKYRAGRTYPTPRVLVLAPTRELAQQINQESLKACRAAGLHSVVVFGGEPKGPQIRQVRRGCDVVIATPGRCMDLIEMRALNLSEVSYCVLDEADRMLDMGFEPQISAVLQNVMAERQTMMFTATWPKEVQQLASKYQKDPIKIVIGNKLLSGNKNITQIVRVTDSMHQFDTLCSILEEVFKDNCKILIFANTRISCELIGQDLWDKNYPINVIHGDMQQSGRDSALRGFREGKFPILMATDVAARGIDVKDIKYVINYNLPMNMEDYVHRIGRTGRAGETGIAYSIVTSKDGSSIKKLVKVLREGKQDIPLELQNLLATAPKSVGKVSRYGRGGNRRGGGFFGGKRGGRGGFGGA